MTACQWTKVEGHYVLEGNMGSAYDGPCYDFEQAIEMCIASPDCQAISSQSNVCVGVGVGAQYRVTHGGPTLTFYADWASLDEGILLFSLSRSRLYG